MADPGFPLGGARPLGAPTSDAGTFGDNVCEDERIEFRWGGGGGGGRTPVASPLGSANDLTVIYMYNCS